VKPALFDRLYTGTETSDFAGKQHLSPCLKYLIFRYFETLKRRGYGGVWVDIRGLRYMKRYAKQHLFIIATEITLLEIRQLQHTSRENLRDTW